MANEIGYIIASDLPAHVGAQRAIQFSRGQLLSVPRVIVCDSLRAAAAIAPFNDIIEVEVRPAHLNPENVFIRRKITL